MDYIPNFQLRVGTDELTLKASPEAEAFIRQQQGILSYRPKGAAAVLSQATALVQAAEGDTGDTKLVLSQHSIQFGKYRGQTFHWLLSNDMGYTSMVMAGHQDERESGDTTTSPAMLNKDSLSRYVRLFPRVMSVIQQRRMANGSLSASSFGDQDDRLVGFGEHAGLTYREFYESADPVVQR